MNIEARINLGRMIAQMYIAAQEISLTASNAACDAMEGADFAMKFGFNSEMAKSQYKVKA